MNSNLIIIAGLPATGKSTIGRYLADSLNYVFISKDSIKESLFDDLGVKDLAWSKELGKASYSLLYSHIEELLKKNISVVVETNFVAEFDSVKFAALMNKYSPNTIQILCYADGDILYKRFIHRAGSNERHQGHLDYEPREGLRELLLQGKAKPLEIDAELIGVDTSVWSEVDLNSLVRRIKERVV